MSKFEEKPRFGNDIIPDSLKKYGDKYKFCNKHVKKSANEKLLKKEIKALKRLSKYFKEKQRLVEIERKEKEAELQAENEQKAKEAASSDSCQSDKKSSKSFSSFLKDAADAVIKAIPQAIKAGVVAATGLFFKWLFGKKAAAA